MSEEACEGRVHEGARVGHEEACKGKVHEGARGGRKEACRCRVHAGARGVTALPSEASPSCPPRRHPAALRGVTELRLNCLRETVGPVGATLSLAFPRLAQLEMGAGLMGDLLLVGAAAFPEACLDLHSVGASPRSRDDPPPSQHTHAPLSLSLSLSLSSLFYLVDLVRSSSCFHFHVVLCGIKLQTLCSELLETIHV